MGAYAVGVGPHRGTPLGDYFRVEGLGGPQRREVASPFGTNVRNADYLDAGKTWIDAQCAARKRPRN